MHKLINQQDIFILGKKGYTRHMLVVSTYIIIYTNNNNNNNNNNNGTRSLVITTSILWRSINISVHTLDALLVEI